MVLDARDQNLLTLLEQVLLDRPYMHDIADVFVKSRIDSHMLRADSESLAMLILVFDVEHEWDASWILAHHFLEEAHRQVDALDYKRLVALVEGIDHLGQLLGHQTALLFVALESDPVFRSVLALLCGNRRACFVRGAEKRRVVLLLQKVSHDVSHRVSREDR